MAAKAKVLRKSCPAIRGSTCISSHFALMSEVNVDVVTKEPTGARRKLLPTQKMEELKLVDPSCPVPDGHLRFVCISDTHNKIEQHGPSYVPDGDVLLHAGDFSRIGLPREIESFNNYLGSLKHRLKIVIAGNHDLTMDTYLVENKREYLKNTFGIRQKDFEDYLESSKLETSRQLLTNCIYLQDSSLTICGIKIYGSPWQPEFGGWGFNLDRGAPLLEKWNMIPSQTDIVMTHGPPLGHGDLCLNGPRAGCAELLKTIQVRVKPRFHIFGHIHEGYGVTSDGFTKFINASTCTLKYKATNPPIIFDFPIPNGHSKDEIETIPSCNLGQT